MANTSLSTEVIRLFTYCKLPLKVLGLYNVLRVTPYKGIQDCLGFWIPGCGFRIPGTGFQYLTIELGVWISIVGGIPDSSALFRNHKQKFPEFWNSLYGAIRGHRRDLKRGGGGGGAEGGGGGGRRGGEGGGGGGGLYSAGLITGLKQHFKTNSSADQNTSCIHSRFYASKRCKKSIQYKLEGGLCLAGLITRCTFSLQVDRGHISGAGGGGLGGGHINGSLRYSATGR